MMASAIDAIPVDGALKAASVGRLGPIIAWYAIGLAVMHLGLASADHSLLAFCLLFLSAGVISFPRVLIAPQCILLWYYGMWFVVSPLFAGRYSDANLATAEYALALSFAFSVMGMMAIGLRSGERFGIARSTSNTDEKPPRPKPPIATIFVLFILSTLFVWLIVMSSGGLQRWIEDPGDAFLNRAGSGIYVVASHFCSQVLAALCGYVAYAHRRPSILLIFLLWVLLTSPVHGSKAQISILVLLALLPWIRNLKPLSMVSALVGASLAGIFLFGLYLRNFGWITAEEMLPYALNYFSGLDLLVVSIRDFEPNLLTTFHFPFRKFLTPFGLSDHSFYFDVNHMLTDIYFPKSWEIRATEQWPVETDLYLNFYFYGGLPLIFGYSFVIGWVYGLARSRDTLGLWFASLMLTIGMVSHLRGSLLNHIDFYMYPYIALSCWLLGRYSLSSGHVRVHAQAR